LKEFYRELAASLKDGKPVAVATVTGTRGSTPRKTGAKMIVYPDGRIAGTIGGGCGEAEVWSEAMQSLKDGKTRLITVDLTESTDGEDKICGGILDVFIEPYLPRE
jgi:xanthine dehydrogenase accessory factor